MKKHLKRFFLVGCLFAVFCLPACGTASPKETATPVPETPAESTAVVTIEPSVSPDLSVSQTEQTAAPEANPESISSGALNEARQSAAGAFTGVMGTEFVVPEGFVQLDESPSVGYQYTFWHPAHEIRIVVSEIAAGSIPEEAFETDCDLAANNPEVTYFNKGENWFVQSGYHNNGEEIFYSKESSGENGLKSFLITYPTAGREFGDSVSADFEKNCHF
ncbi:MAG: hypothetical protein K6C08_11000 [Oscillospiraceae bacterium]|nr:hypothetical protein [Oscillospiraceae bacterium]